MVRAAIAYFSAKLEDFSPDALDYIQFIAMKSVQYAEEKGLNKKGEEKLQLALDYAQKRIDSFEEKYGLPDMVDVDFIYEEIHSALYEEINKNKALPSG